MGQGIISKSLLNVMVICFKIFSVYQSIYRNAVLTLIFFLLLIIIISDEHNK